MMRTQWPFLPASLVPTCLVLCACQADPHTMAETKDGKLIVCKSCYDEVYTVQHSTRSRLRGTVTQTHTKHECPDCKAEVSISTENGVAIITCAKCAPEGVRCDKCLPPKDWSPPKGPAASTSK